MAGIGLYHREHQHAAALMAGVGPQHSWKDALQSVIPLLFTDMYRKSLYVGGIMSSTPKSVHYKSPVVRRSICKKGGEQS